MSMENRRRFARADAEINCKIRRDARTLFTPGRTTNISPGGAAIELLGPREARIGERVALAFEHATCPVTRAAHMITATVVRAGPMAAGSQAVAVAFDTPQFGLQVLDTPRMAA